MENRKNEPWMISKETDFGEPPFRWDHFAAGVCIVVLAIYFGSLL